MTTTITIEGMSCEHCEQTIEEALCDIDEVSDARANREADTATVEGNPDTGDLIRAAEDAGYTAHA
jgi:copper chaperone